MAVLSRAREQQAVEAGERPMPVEEPERTYAQRVNYYRSGLNAKRLMYYIPAPSEGEVKRTVRPQKTHFKNPTDFYAGPSDPGRVLGGPRRYDGMNVDSVAYVMTEEYQAYSEPRGPIKPVGGPQHIDNNCYPFQHEPKPRLLVKQIHEKEGLDAPYYEDNNPKDARDEKPVNSVKIFPERTHQTTNLVFPPPPAKEQPLHGNSRNKSKDLLNLHQYSAAQLHEKEPHRVVGPRKWVAPEMDYPKRRPGIRPIKSSCTDCHDVMGTERFGHRPEIVHGKVAVVADYPYKDHTPLYQYVESQPGEPRPVKPNTLIRYYDPAIDDVSKFTNNEKVVGKAHPPGKPMNYLSNSHYVQGGGRARGVYGRSNQSSIVLA